MGDPATHQLGRERFLKNLASDPQEALRYWKKLKAGEDAIVLNEMERKYGSDFSREFKKTVSAKKRPDLYYMVTNVNYITPESLKRGGYKLKSSISTLSTLEIWVHPSGKEIWRISSAQGAPPAAVKPKQVPPPPPPPTHPDVEEVEIYAEQYAKRKQEMIESARRLEASRSALPKDAYEKQRGEWWKEYEAWDSEIDEIFSEIVPEMQDTLLPAELIRKQDALNELRDLQLTWPADVMDPKPP